MLSSEWSVGASILNQNMTSPCCNIFSGKHSKCLFLSSFNKALAYWLDFLDLSVVCDYDHQIRSKLVRYAKKTEPRMSREFQATDVSDFHDEFILSSNPFPSLFSRRLSPKDLFITRLSHSFQRFMSQKYHVGELSQAKSGPQEGFMFSGGWPDVRLRMEQVVLRMMFI